MSPSRWQEIERLYNRALDRPPDEREAFVIEECGEDVELRREVASLLAQDPSKAGTLDRPAWDSVAGQMGADATITLLAKGTHVGPYRIEELLGKGGMGEVFRGFDSRLNRAVAVKILSTSYASPSDRRRFQREAQMASALNHPNILTVHDVGEFEGRQYLVSELIEGGTEVDPSAETTG